MKKPEPCKHNRIGYCMQCEENLSDSGLNYRIDHMMNGEHITFDKMCHINGWQPEAVREMLKTGLPFKVTLKGNKDPNRKETEKKIGKIISWIIQNGFDEFVDNIKEKI